MASRGVSRNVVAREWSQYLVIKTKPNLTANRQQSTMMSTTIILSTLICHTIGFATVQTTTIRPSTSLFFFGNAAKKTSAVKSSPFAEEAVEIYTNKYPTSGNTRQKFFFESWGMPGAYQAPVDSSESIFTRQVNELTATFNTIASIYGDEEALKMVKIQPNVLAFNKDNIGPSLDAFGEKFGYDESKEMIIRNPGLLGTRPAAAAEADDLTMQMSYVVDITRPIGAFGPLFLIALLSVPAIESAAGVSRGELFASFF